MAPLRKYTTLLLTVFCLGCAQVSPQGFETDNYQTSSPPHGSTGDTVSPQVNQGVGFSTSTGAAVSGQAAQSSASAQSTAIEGATVLALLGLLALIIIADEAQACSGLGCGGDGFSLSM